MCMINLRSDVVMVANKDLFKEGVTDWMYKKVEPKPEGLSLAKKNTIQEKNYEGNIMEQNNNLNEQEYVNETNALNGNASHNHQDTKKQHGNYLNGNASSKVGSTIDDTINSTTKEFDSGLDFINNNIKKRNFKASEDVYVMQKSSAQELSAKNGSKEKKQVRMFVDVARFVYKVSGTRINLYGLSSNKSMSVLQKMKTRLTDDIASMEQELYGGVKYARIEDKISSDVKNKDYAKSFLKNLANNQNIPDSSLDDRLNDLKVSYVSDSLKYNLLEKKVAAVSSDIDKTKEELSGLVANPEYVSDASLFQQKNIELNFLLGSYSRNLRSLKKEMTDLEEKSKTDKNQIKFYQAKIIDKERKLKEYQTALRNVDSMINHYDLVKLDASLIEGSGKDINLIETSNDVVRGFEVMTSYLQNHQIANQDLTKSISSSEFSHLDNYYDHLGALSDKQDVDRNAANGGGFDHDFVSKLY